jgi:hypothetical protein
MQMNMMNTDESSSMEAEPKLIALVESFEYILSNLLHTTYSCWISNIIARFEMFIGANQYMFDCGGFVDIVKGKKFTVFIQ